MTKRGRAEATMTEREQLRALVHDAMHLAYEVLRLPKSDNLMSSVAELVERAKQLEPRLTGAHLEPRVTYVTARLPTWGWESHDDGLQVSRVENHTLAVKEHGGGYWQWQVTECGLARSESDAKATALEVTLDARWARGLS